MIYQSCSRSFTPVVIVLLCTCIFAFRGGSAAAGTTDLQQQVAALNLGMQGYTIGAGLTPDQKDASAANLLEDSYQGTYKFRDGELHVVVAAKDDTVLALYQRNENADFEQARKMISGLMGLYGEPTAMAHDKLIYWAYKAGGKISEEEYNASKEKDGRIDVLATVKFSTEVPLTEENSADETGGTIYFIVSSDRLTDAFMKNE